MRIGKGLGLVMLGAALAAPAQAFGPLDLCYERTLMAEAGARCGLFSNQIETALGAAAAQARNAALRGGRPALEVEATQARAADKARSVACASPDLTQAAGKVRTAFAVWAKVSRTSYPGLNGGWVADRKVYHSAAWRLVETAPGGAAFGLAGSEGGTALVAVLPPRAGDAPSGARLKFRDASRSRTAWLPGGANVSALPPASAQRVVFADSRTEADPGLSHRLHGATAFRFPAAAAEGLSKLDPRERFAVEFIFPGGRVETAEFEVGDFAAGRSFLAMGPM